MTRKKKLQQLSSEIDRSNYIAFFTLSAHCDNGMGDDNDETKEAHNEMTNAFDWLCQVNEENASQFQ